MAQGEDSWRRMLVWLLLAFTILLMAKAFLPEVKNSRENHDWLIDIVPYFLAGELVATHQGSHMYDGADLGVDPQFRIVPDDITLATLAKRHGLAGTAFYLYPPLLADLLVPATALPIRTAAHLWAVFNTLVFAGCCLLLCRMLRYPLLSPAMCLVFCSALTWPVLNSILLGQISMIVLFCWLIAIYGFSRGWMFASSLALALGTALKLTPLIAVMIFLLWREWRWMAYYAANVLALLSFMLLVNGPHVVLTFFMKVLPAMSVGISNTGNRTIPALFSVLYQARFGAFHPEFGMFFGAPVPHGIIIAGKLASAMAVSAFVAVLLVTRSSKADLPRKMELLAATAVLSIIVSPVSWLHAYTLALPLLCFAWLRAFEYQQPLWRLVLLVLITIELGQQQISGRLFVHLHWKQWNTATGIATPLMACLLILLTLFPSRLGRRETTKAEPSQEMLFVST